MSRYSARGSLGTPSTNSARRASASELGLPYPSEGVQQNVKGIDNRLKIAEVHCLCHPLARRDFAEEWELAAVDAIWELIDMPEREAIFVFTELTEKLLNQLGARR